MFYNAHPKLYYTLDDNKTIQIVTDIFKRIDFTAKTREATSAFYKYTVRDGETPEILAYNVYGDTLLHWVILHTNQIVNLREEWPMTNDTFNRFLLQKYGTLPAVYAERHKEIIMEGESIITEQSIGNLVPKSVSNYEYEFRLNEAKRNILLLKAQYVPDCINEFESLLKAS